MSCSDQEFVSTYNRYVDMIYRLCFSFLNKKEDTEDAVQSVFVKYIKRNKHFENECHEKAWFIVTASNTCKDMLRQSWRHNISIETCDFISDKEDTASPVFREYIHSLLFPLYTSDEIVSINNGHMTGSFDIVDVLLSFLDKFNKEEFGNSITAARENGYHYSLFAQNEDGLLAFVDSSIEGYCIVVYMERIAYESTEGIWQITGYQILEKSTAEDMKKQFESYSDISTEEIISVPQKNPAIKGQEDSVVMYNVNDKINVVSVNENDGRIISDILNACDRNENIAGGLFQYVVKIYDTSYMFDSNGNGMVNTKENRWGITINENDLKVIMALFEQYNISLEETR